MSSSNTTDAEAMNTIPTIDEIETSGIFITRNSWTTHSVKRIREVFAVKYGESASLLVEADTLRYLYDHGICVPRLHAVLTSKKTVGNLEKYYLIMEYIDGNSYLKTLPELTTREKDAVDQQFRQLMLTLRSLPSEGYYGAMCHRPFCNSVLNYPSDEPLPIQSPFLSEAQLLDYLKALVHLLAPSHGSLLSAAINQILVHNQPIFTHGDLQDRNTILQPTGVNQAGERTFRFILIDWEYAGWYPEYWEYCIAALHKQDGWMSLVNAGLEMYVKEFSLLWMIKQLLEDMIPVWAQDGDVP